MLSISLVAPIHIAPAMGSVRLGKVVRRDVERLAERMIAGGLSPKTVRNVLRVLSAIYEYAIDLEWTRENPVRTRGNLLEHAVVGERGEDELGGLGDLTRRVAPSQAVIDELL